jgi:hypothetical protein
MPRTEDSSIEHLYILYDTYNAEEDTVSVVNMATRGEDGNGERVLFQRYAYPEAPTPRFKVRFEEVETWYYIDPRYESHGRAQKVFKLVDAY